MFQTPHQIKINHNKPIISSIRKNPGSHKPRFSFRCYQLRDITSFGMVPWRCPPRRVPWRLMAAAVTRYVPRLFWGSIMLSFLYYWRDDLNSYILSLLYCLSMFKWWSELEELDQMISYVRWYIYMFLSLDFFDMMGVLVRELRDGTQTGNGALAFQRVQRLYHSPGKPPR